MYFFHSHNEHNKLLDIFDNANVLECYRRTESIVPQQALALWNSKLAHDDGREDQRRAARASDKDVGRRRDSSTAAFETILGDDADEPTNCARACESLAAIAQAALEGPEGTGPRRNAPACKLVQALINHNDFVTVR